MDTSIRASRDAVAMERIGRASSELSARFGVPFDAEGHTRTANDPAVRVLFSREAVADLLDALLEATAPKPESEPTPDAFTGAGMESKRRK